MWSRYARLYCFRINRGKSFLMVRHRSHGWLTCVGCVERLPSRQLSSAAKHLKNSMLKIKLSNQSRQSIIMKSGWGWGIRRVEEGRRTVRMDYVIQGVNGSCLFLLLLSIQYRLSYKDELYLDLGSDPRLRDCWWWASCWQSLEVFRVLHGHNRPSQRSFYTESTWKNPLAINSFIT